MNFQISFHPDVADDFSPLPHNIKQRLKGAITNRLSSAPHFYGKPLRGELKSLWSLRVGDYRVIYQLKQQQVLVIQVIHRKDAYDVGILEARVRGML